VWSQDVSDLYDQLYSNDAAEREKACQALAKEGAAIMEDLFYRMGGENKTEDMWLKRTVDTIVFNACRPDAEEEKTTVEQALFGVIDVPYPPEIKQFACIQLSLVGGKAAAEALGLRLHNIFEREAARYALERITHPQAAAIITEALGRAHEPEWKIALIKTLGAKKDVSAFDAVAKFSNDPNEDVRIAVINAISHMPDPRIRDIYTERSQNGSQREISAVFNGALVVAEELIAMDIVEEAASIYRMFISSEFPLARCAALAGLADSLGVGALSELKERLNDSDYEVRGVALDRLAPLPGENVTASLIELLDKMEGDTLIAVIQLLEQRSDPAVAPALPKLLQIINESDGKLQQAAASAVTAMPGGEISNAVRSAIEGSSIQVQSVLIRILGHRGDQASLPLILNKCKSPDTFLRVAALETLGLLADPSAAETLNSALDSENTAIRNAAAGSVATVAEALEKNGQKQEAIDLCIKAARAASDLSKVRQLIERLRVLGATEIVAEMAERSGFITHWWVVGPLRTRESLRGEDYLNPAEAVDVSKPVASGRREIAWKKVLVDDPSGQLDLERALVSRSDVGAYLFAEVESPETQKAIFKIGSDDDVFCWLNGESVHKFVGDRGWNPDQDSVSVELKQGKNQIVLKVLNGGGQWAASLLILNENGEKLQLQQRTE
jgi:HEAT repeat protein